MNTNKLLTIIIPIYNMEKSLEQCLSSTIIMNGMDELEVLMIDDGSNDSSFLIAKRFEEMYPNTFKLIKKENGGVGSVINIGIEKARGKYFKEVDSDDYLNSRAVEQLLTYLRRTDVDVIINPFIFVGENNSILKRSWINQILNGREKKIDDIIKDNMEKTQNYFSIQSMTIKTALFRNNNVKLKEVKYYIDMQIVNECLLYANNCAVMYTPLYFYRVGQNEQSISLSSYINNQESFLVQIFELLRIYYIMNSCISDKYHYKLLKLRNDIISYCKIMFSIFLLSNKKTKHSSTLLKKFDYIIYEVDPEIYYKLSKAFYIRFLRFTKYNFLDFHNIYYKIWFELKNKKNVIHVFENI